MIVFWIFISILSVVSKDCITNMLCKTKLKTANDINSFNAVSYFICIIVFGILLISEQISWFTVIVALLFGVVTAVSAMYNMLALSTGPMHLTMLIITSSMIIPTLSGVFFGEKFSILKFITCFVLIGFIYLSLDKANGKKINKKWYFFCALSFVLQGAIGVIQKIHQSSEHKNETAGFLFVTFICSIIFVVLKNKSKVEFKTLGRRNVSFAIICGICVVAMNYINLKLSGILPSQLFFPLINGSCIVLSSLASLILFREKLNSKQLVGLIGGIASLIAICLVP